MKTFYLLVFMAVFAFSLSAQSSMSLASNNNTFYITDTNCENANPNDGIIWPCDFETNNCSVFSDPSITGEPVITNDELSHIKITFEDIVNPKESADDCLKLLRKWKVTDLQPKSESKIIGIWEYTQTIKLIKSAKPVFVSEIHDQEFCIYNYDCSTDFIELKAAVEDDCTSEDVIKFAYEIDLNNNGSIDFKGNTSDASDIFPFGKHKIYWFAEDGCGNIAKCEYFFEVKDCKLPVANCVNGLMVELLPDEGEVTLIAEDFNQGSTDNCSVEEYRIISPSRGEGQTLPPPRDSKSVTFNCASIGVNSVDLWVKDNAFNWSYCTTFVIVQGNDFDCENRVVEEKTFAEEISRFVEEIPLEIEKIVIPDEDIQQSDNVGFKIFPSQPNPFEVETKISFELEEKAAMTFTVRDVSGKVIKIIEKEFLAGYNQIILKKEEFEEAGIYFFTLQSKKHTATGKIVLIQR